MWKSGMTDRIRKMYCYYPAAERWCPLGIRDHHWLRSFRNEFKISAKDAMVPSSFLGTGLSLNYSLHWRVFTKISLGIGSFCVLLNTPKEFPFSNSSVGVWCANSSTLLPEKPEAGLGWIDSLHWEISSCQSPLRVGPLFASKNKSGLSLLCRADHCENIS